MRRPAHSNVCVKDRQALSLSPQVFPLPCWCSRSSSLLRQLASQFATSKGGLLAHGRSHHFCHIYISCLSRVAISISLSQMEMAVLIHCTCSSPPHSSSLPPKLPYCFSTCMLSGLKIQLNGCPFEYQEMKRLASRRKWICFI